MDLIALNTIHRVKKAGKDATATNKAVAPQTEVIAPGEAFTATEDEGNELIGLKAARKDTAKKAPAKSNTAKTPAKAAAKQADKDAVKEPDEMNVEELKAELDSLETEYASNALKADLVTALTEARSGGLV